jgi:sortase A
MPGGLVPPGLFCHSENGMITRTVEGFLLGLGLVLLAYVGYVMLDREIFQAHQQQRLEQSVHAPKEPVDPNLVGSLLIPRIGVNAVVMKGDDAGTLDRAAGLIPGTALPGQPGNVGVAAHRDSFFRGLRNIRGKDEIIFKTPRGEYHYRVDSLRIVRPENVEVLNPTPYSALTLVTCYPFGYIGHAPKRFIVRARQVEPAPASIVSSRSAAVGASGS